MKTNYLIIFFSLLVCHCFICHSITYRRMLCKGESFVVPFFLALQRTPVNVLTPQYLIMK
uniref:Uncharacterized protein n=1 Tax=Rhizophora mucronata TaxID=61149 RepID=A0A2P2PPV9_RHIMU